MYPITAPAASPVTYLAVPTRDEGPTPTRPRGRATDAALDAALADATALLSRIDRERRADADARQAELQRQAFEAEARARRLDAILAPDGRPFLQSELAAAVRELADRFGPDAVRAALACAGYPTAA